MAVYVKQAVFLVGGKGARLGQVTARTPKPLLDIGDGLCLLDILIEQAARHGFRDILLLAGYFGDMVEARYDGRRVRSANLRVIREPEPAGTGGALALAKDNLDPWFFLANGDTFFDANLRALTAGAGVGAGFLARLALREAPDVSRYGSVSLDGDVITSFGEKTEARRGPGTISAGAYLMNRDILDFITGPASLETDVFAPLARRGLLRGSKLDGYFIDIGVPDTLERARRELPARRRRPAAFLDRDGVLNVDRGYVHSADRLEWIRNAPEAVRFLNEAGHYVIVVTNQAGVARGYYGEDEMHAFHDHLQAELAACGAHIDDFYHCPFHPDAVTEAYRSADHPDRKPNPGMVMRALAEWPIEADHSFLVGDMEDDMAAARRAGVAGHLFHGGDLLQCVRLIVWGSAHPTLRGTDGVRPGP